MRKSSKARLFSTCLTGAILAAASPAWGQTSDAPTWKPRAEVDAQVGKDIGVSTSLFAPIAQNDSSLVFVDGRIGYDQRFDRNGSATVGARFRTGEDTAIGVNVGADFYRSDIGSRDQAAVSMGLEGFSSVFDVRVNYRLPLSKTRTIGYIDPNAAGTAALVLESNRLIERHSGFRLEAIPLQGFNGEAGVRLPVGDNASIRGSVGGFDYWDKDADQSYRGYRVGLEMDIEDKDSGARFTFGGTLEDDNRFGTDARATVRLSIPFGGRAGDRGAVPTGLDRQMGDRVRRDYVARSGSRYTDLTTSRFAVDARTGNQFGGFYYASGTGVVGAAGTLATPTTIADAVSRAGTNGVVVALGSGGNITTPGVTLATDQYLVGGASAVDVRLLNGSTVSYALGGTNGVVVGTNAAGAAVTLGQGSVVRDVTVRGAGVGVAATGVGGFALDRVVIENTGGAGLALINTLGNVALTGLTIRGGAGAGVLVNGGSSVSLANSMISGGAGAVDINDGGANLAVSLSNLTLFATGGNVLDVDGSGAGTVTVTGMAGLTIRGGTGETGGVSVRSATFDASTTTAGVQTVNAGRMEVGTTGARLNGQGVFLTDVTGSLSFADLDIANSGATGLHVVNSKVNSFTLATLDGTVDTVGGTAIDLDPLVINLNFTSVNSLGAGGPGVILDTVQGGGTGGNALTIGSLTVTNSGGDGLVVLNSTGLVRVNGGTIGNSGGSSVRIGTQGVAGSGGSANLVFGGTITDASGASPIVAIFNAGGTISFTGPISGSGGILVEDTLAGSAINFGAITLTGTIGDAITLDGLAGSIRFNGLVTIANPGANGIVIGDVPGGVTFGDVDITGLGDFTGLDVRGAQGNVLFNTLDITGTGFGTGIDLTGSTNAGNVMILGGSVIEGVDIGVDLTQASMTGQFRFGDGDATVMNSRITANVPIVIELMNAGHGSYNFADVVLQGDTSNLTGAGFTAYYAQVGATGVGTRNDPGSLAGADASNAQFIVLLNDAAGGQDVFDAASAGGSFDLAAGQSLVSFLNGDFVAVSGASMPANLVVSGLGPSGITNIYAGSGGAVLTTSTAGSATVNLANNSAIDGLIIRNAGGDVGVEGSGVSNVRIVNSNISGATGAIAISDGGVASSVQLTHLDLASTSGTTLALSGAGAGTLTVSAADVDVDATGTSAALSITDVTSGGISFGSVSTGTSATRAVSVENVSGGGVTFGSIAVAGTVTGEGVAIGSSSSAVTIGSISVGGSEGDAVLLAGNSGAISLGSVDATVNGTNGNGLFAWGGGNIAIGALTIAGGDVGLAIEDLSGAITIGGGSVSGADYGVNIVNVAAGGSVSIGALDVTGSAVGGIGLLDIAGSVAFTGTTSVAGSGIFGILLGGGSTGTIAFGDVDITGLGANATGVHARDASGTISFNTLDITGNSTVGTRGIDLTGASFATDFTTTESGSITGVGVGVDLTNAAITGSFRYGDGSSTDADGAASAINAVTPIVITGVNAAVGSYNFLDVVLTGDTSTLTSSATLYFVKAGATGVGTMADPGSLAGAEASAASTIILLNDPTGGQDLLDAAGAGGSLDLVAGQSLLSFLGGDTLLLPGGAPSNLLLYGVPQGQIGNPYAGSGAPILTTSVGGANTVTLGGGNTIDGVVIQTGAGGGAGIFGSGVANIVIRNSNISGAGGAIHLIDNGAAADVALSNLLLAASGGNVLELDGSGAGTLAVTALSDITIAGNNGETGGFLATDIVFDADLATAGAQTVVGSLAVGAAGARLEGVGVSITGDGSIEFTNLQVVNLNSYGVNLFGNAGLTAIVRAGSIDTVDADALVAQNAALSLDFDTITTSAGGGIYMDGNTAADAGAPVLNVRAMNLSGGMSINGVGGDYVFANASIIDNVDVAVRFGGTVNIDYAGDISSGAGASATIATLGHSGGTVTFHDGTIDVTGGAGFQFHNADGTYSFTGTATLHGGDAGINVANGSSGSFFFGTGTSVTNGAVANFALDNSDANVTYLGSLSQGLNTDNFRVIGQTGGMLDFSQATISASAGSGLLFIDADGNTTLGDVQLSGGAGIAIVTDSAGAISFDNIDITGVGANQTAVDLTGALGNVTFQTLDIAGMSTVGSKGIDLTGSTTAANIIISESSNITGVGVGVDLTNAAITGSFRFGDGSSVDADGAASLISAGVPIEVTGLNTGVGTYNFADVNLVGDTSRLVTSATTYFVKAGATGAGTMADPGNLSGAEASGAQIIVLLNDPTGGQDVLDAVDAGGSFDLFDGQSLLGFLNGDTLTLPAGGPTNLILFGLTPGQITNPFASSGAPLLTNSGAGNTLELRSNTVVDGVLIDASNGLGILGLPAANVTIRNSVVSGSLGAIRLMDGAANASAALRNLQLSASGGAVLDLDGNGAGTLTITALDDIIISGGNGETFGIRGSRVTFDSDLVAAGIQTVAGSLQVGTAAARIGGSGISLENSDGAVDFAVDVATDGGSGLYVIGSPGGLRFSTSGGTIDAINAAGGFGLYLRDVSSAVTLDAISVAGGTGVATENVTGVGAGGNALTVESLTVADGAAGGIVMTGSATGSFTFGQSSNIGNVTGSPIVLSSSGASAFTYNGDVNFSGASALLSVSGGHSGTVTFALGTLTATSGTGLVFDNADGTYAFSSTANLAAGIKIANGSAGGFTFSNIAITNPSGSALDIQDSTASLSYAGDITFAGAVTPAIYIGNHSGGTISFGAGSLTTTGGNGLTFFNADGTYNFANTVDIDATLSGIAIGGDSSGSFDFGAATSIVTTGGSALDVSGSSASVDYRGQIGATGGYGVNITDHAGGTIDLSGATMTLAGGAQLRFDNADSTYDFGAIAGASGSRIIFLNGSAGTFTFGDVDLADIGTNQTAVDLTGATGNVTFQTLDITGTSTTGSKGIDLTGSTTAANIIVNESSSITGVGIGIDLTNAAITGTFRYGDGSSAIPNGAASSISAVTPLAIGGLNPGVGTYDFADVVLTGDTSGLQTNKTVYWVQLGAVGAGTRADPGSLAGAEASGADVIILLDTQAGAGQDILDAVTAGGGLDLIANQSLLSFLNGDTLSVGGGAPANLLLFGLAGGTVTNPYAGSGAPLLTTTLAGATTVNLASGALIDGVQIGNLNWKGVFGAGVTGVTIRNSIIHGHVHAIEINDGGGSADIALSNLDLSSSTNHVLSLIGSGGGQLSVTALNGITIRGGNMGSGLYSEDVTFDADLATAGIQTVTGTLNIGSASSRVGAWGLGLDGAGGALSLATTIFNTNGYGIFASGAPGFTLAITGGTIDTGLATVTSAALDLSNLSADIQLASVVYSGTDTGVRVNNVTGVGAGGRALDVTQLTVASGANTGISLLGTTSGNFSFGSASSIVGTTTAGVALANTGTGTFTYAGGITGITSGALISASNGDVGNAAFSGTLGATGGTGLRFDNADGTYSFLGSVTLNGGDAGLDILNGSSGTFLFETGTSITSPSGAGIDIQASTAAVHYRGTLTFATAGQAAVNIADHSGGTIMMVFPLNITNGTGLQFDNADGTYDFTGTTTLNGGDAGIDILNGSAGTFNFGAGTSITSPSGTGITIADSTAAFSYLGSLTYATAGQAAVSVINHSGGMITFQGGTISATNGTGLQFDNADGTYTFGGTTTLNGGDAGIDILNGSAGTFSFGTGTSITSPSGIGITIADSDAALSYSGNLTYATAAQAAINVINHATGTIAFQTGTLNVTNGTGLQFDNADGTYTFGGTTTLNGGDAGIDILNGSAGAFTFGTGTAITSPSGTGINVQNSTAAITYSGNLTYATAGQFAIDIANHATGTILFQTGTLSVTDGSGVRFVNADGVYDFTGTANLSNLAIGFEIGSGSNGTFDFGSGTSVAATVAGLYLNTAAADVTYSGTLTSSLGAALAALDDQSTLDMTAATWAVTGGSGMDFNNADGTYSFGSFAFSGGARLSVTNGSAGTFTFGDVDLSGIGAGQTAVNLTGATGDMTFDTLDITGASAAGSKGIDLTGNTGTGDIIVANGSAIIGVGIGVDLTNASRPGLFQYGDGNPAPLNSSINATTPIVIAGLNGGSGTYDFLDVTLTGDTGPLKVSAFFARAGASGIGTQADPGSLAAADLSTASYIVLLDSQAGAASDTLTGTLDLAPGQALLSFGFSDTLTVTGGAPTNVKVSGITGNSITDQSPGNGAPLLTSADALGTVRLGGANLIEGVTISNTGTGAGVYANGTSGLATLRDSRISGGGAAVDIRSGAQVRTVNLQNLTLANAGNQTGALLNLDGTGGTLTVTGLSNLTINTAGGETAGLVFNTVTFDADVSTVAIDAVDAGAMTIGTAGARVQGDGLSLTNVSGALTFADIDIANNGGTGLLVANSKVNNFLLTTGDGSVDTTSGTAVNLDPLTVNIKLGSVTATGGAYGILLDQVEGSFTVNGAVSVTGATSAGIAIQDNTAPLAASFVGAVSVNNTTGAGLSLTNNAGATINFSGGGTGVDVVTTSGAGLIASGGGTISFAGAGNSIQTATGRVVNIDGVTAGAGGMAFASLANSGVVANTAILINNLDGGAFSGGNVTVAGTSGATSDGIWIGGGSGSAISFGTATIGGTGDEGIEINGAGNGAIGFLSTIIDNTGGDGIRITGSTGTVTVSGGDIGNLNDPTGSGVVIDGGSGAITINAGILKTTAARAVEVTNRTADSVDFGGFISSGGAASGWFLHGNSGGTITFSGSKAINTTGSIALELFNNAGATINFTNGGLAITSTQQGIQATGGGVLNITGAGNTISSNGTAVIELNGMTVGANGINFATVSSTSIGNGIALTNVGSAGGAIALGTVNLQGMLARGIDINGTLGAALTITDLDIGLANAGAVALDLNNAALSAAVTANDFDVTSSSAVGTIAVDLRGTTGGQVVRLGDTTVGGASATIAGVATGVLLNAASNATFTYGDGESATDGTSTISAATGINAAAAPVAGNYDFRDVTFGASPGLGFGVGRTWFVDSNGATGGGNGSGADGGNPMTLGAAELALAATDVIVLVNNGIAISTAGSNGNDTLALLADTQVRGFGQGPLALTLTVPGTIQLSSNTINIADPTGNGAATLTSAAGANVITLGASANRISGFILDGAPGGALRGILDNGGATGTVINFMTIRNFGAVGGYGVEITPSTNSVIDNVSFTGNTNDVLLNAAGSTITNVTATGATGTSITLDNATGTTTLTNVSISGAATGMSFTNGAGTINAVNVDIAGAGTSALTVSGGTASFNFDGASSIVQATGGLTLNVTGNHTTGTFAFAGLINATTGNGMQFSNADGTYNFTGITTLNGDNAGIDIYNGATGTFSFGSATNLTHNGAGNAFVLLSSANLTFDGAITDNDGVAVEIDGHDAGTAIFNGAISSSIANASNVISIAHSNAGAVTFNGAMAIASTGTAVSLTGNQGSTITFNAGGTGLDITGTTSTAMIVTGGGTVNVQGANNSITTTSGTLLSITDTGGTATAVDLSFASASNTGGANGVFVQRVGAGTVTGTVNIGGGAITATTRGVSLNGDALNFTYGGTLTTSGGASRSFEATNRTGGIATLSGNLTDTSLGISIANNTGGTVNFTGQTISLNTGANTAVTLSNNSGATVNFASAGGGNGLDIVTTGGAGISATGGGTLTVTGAGNSIQTATGPILNFTGVSAGASGVTFASLQSTGTVAGIAINLNNFDSVGGGAFSGGTTSVAATSGGNDGIFIGNGSAANVSFGATTIGTGTISGDGIEINGSGNGAVTFTSVDIDNTTAHGVSIVGAAGATGAVAINGGTIGAGGAGSITGDGVNVTGGSGSVTVAASIAKTNAGNVVEVSSHTAGTVAFSNTISATGGAANGILLSNNSGGTITFSGATKTLNTGANNAIQFDNNAATGAAVSFTGGNLDVDTTTGRGITGTSTNAGAGSLTIQGTNNTINSAGGIALNLVNTNITGGGLNFLSISANGGTRGIVLNTTGGAGGLTITGTGTTDGSGGTIQNITQRGIELLDTALVNIANLNLTNASTSGQVAGQDLDLTTANGAIYMNGVATAVFNNINITGTIADNGITGIDVSNFQLNNSLITGAGDGANESGIEFSNLSGTSSLTNTEIALSETNSLDIVNTDVNLNLTLNNVIFRDTQSSGIGEGGLQFRSFSNAAGTPTTNIDVVDSDFLRIRTQGIQIIGEDDSVVSVDITNSVIDSQTGIGAGIDINGNDTSTVRFNIIGNPTIRSSGGAAVNITSFISANVMGRIANNADIEVYSQTPAGTGASGSGVRLLAQENSHLTVSVTGNTLTQGAGNNSAAVDVIAREGSARLDLTLTGNVIDSTDVNTLADINLQSGSSSGTNIETNQIYANIANNNLTATAAPNLLRLRVSELDNTHDPRIFLQGFVEGGAGIEDDAVATWNGNGNTPGATAASIAVSLTGTATGPSAGTAQTPINPLP